METTRASIWRRIARRLTRYATGRVPQPEPVSEPPAPPVIMVEPLTFESLNELPLATILDLAKQLSWTRPCKLYPGWRFDRDFEHPGLAFQLRRKIWSYFRDRKEHVPIVIDWCDGLCIQIYLGNDISRQLFIAGCFEPNEFAFLDRVLKPGMTFLDAGANDGLFSLFASRRVGTSGQVWSFEPSQREFERLSENYRLNNLPNMHCCKIALSNFEGAGTLKVAEEEHAGLNTLGEFAYDVGLVREEKVPVVRLDDLIAREGIKRVDLVKIDAEGAELNILRGAEAMFQQFRPFVLLEVSDRALQHQGASSTDLAQLFASHDYRLFNFDSQTGELTPSRDGVFTDNVVAAARESTLALSYPDVA